MLLSEGTFIEVGDVIQEQAGFSTLVSRAHLGSPHLHRVTGDCWLTKTINIFVWIKTQKRYENLIKVWYIKNMKYTRLSREQRFIPNDVCGRM